MDGLSAASASKKVGTASPLGNDPYVNNYYRYIQHQQDVNNAWSAEQAQKQMDFQEYMSNTAHQREIADLKAAGLNPVLSAGGNGASTGTGAMAERSDANISALYNLINKSIDAQIEQSKALNNSARSYGTVASSSDSDNGLLDIVADIMYRRYGIKQENFKEGWKWIKDYLMGATSSSEEFDNYFAQFVASGGIVNDPAALAAQQVSDPRARDYQKIKAFFRNLFSKNHVDYVPGNPGYASGHASR